MTVSYTAKVSSAKSFGCFLKLLFRWRGSIYKLVWPDLAVFLTAFFSLSFLYRFVLTDPQQRIFERIAAYCDKYGTLIPVSFVLGFYVTIVVGRWWQQYQSIPWIDTLAIWVNSNVHGLEEKDRLLRRTILRYTCLAITQCFTLISPRVKKRFPSLDNFVESGLLLENEKEMIAEINKGVATRAKFPTHWIPLVWATSIVTRARTEDKIKNDSAFRAMMDELNKIKDQCAILISFDWISVPLVYTQVVTLAVYVYFFSCIMGRQWVKAPMPTSMGGEESETEAKGQTYETQNARSANIDLFFPVFTVLQFFFYMGWLKVAESLLCPFGDDDDDFELNWIVDRNIQVAYLIVDEMHLQHPDLLKDQYWEVVVPEELPHTQASEQYKELSHVSSTANLNLLPGDTKIFRTSSIRSTIRSHHPDDGVVLMPGTPKFDRDRGSIKSKRDQRFGNQHSTSVSLQSQMDSEGGGRGGSKINRIGSALRRMISRDREQEESLEGENPISGSFKSQSGFAGSTRRLNKDDDVIPELDENMVTIVSNKSAHRADRRPTAQEVFSRDREEYAPIFVMESDPDLAVPPTSFDSMTVKAEAPENKNPTSQTLEESTKQSFKAENLDKNKIVFY